MGRGIRPRAAGSNARTSLTVAVDETELVAEADRTRQWLDEYVTDAFLRARLVEELTRFVFSGAKLADIRSFRDRIVEIQARADAADDELDPPHSAAWWAVRAAIATNPEEARFARAFSRMALQRGPADILAQYRPACQLPSTEFLEFCEALAEGRYLSYRYDLAHPTVQQQIGHLTDTQRSLWLTDESLTFENSWVPDEVLIANSVLSGEIQLLLDEDELPESVAQLLRLGEGDPASAVKLWQERRRALGLAIQRGASVVGETRESIRAALSDLGWSAENLTLEDGSTLRQAAQSYALAEDLLAIWYGDAIALATNQLRVLGTDVEGNARSETARRKLERLAHVFSDRPSCRGAMLRSLEVLKQCGDVVRENQLKVGEEIDPTTLLTIGASPVETCQHYATGERRHCLLAYLLDADKKVVTVRDAHGELLARAILRLARDTQNGQPVLFLERAYTDQRDRRRFINYLERFVFAKAERMGLRSYGYDMYGDLEELTIAPSRNGIQYVDSLHGEVPNVAIGDRDMTGHMLPQPMPLPVLKNYPSLNTFRAVSGRLAEARLDPAASVSIADLKILRDKTTIADRIGALQNARPARDLEEPVVLRRRGEVPLADWVALDFAARSDISYEEARHRGVRELRRMGISAESALTDQMVLALAVQRQEGCALYQARRAVREALAQGGHFLGRGEGLHVGTFQLADQVSRGEPLPHVLTRAAAQYAENPQTFATLRTVTLATICTNWHPSRGRLLPPSLPQAPAKLGKSVNELRAVGKAQLPDNLQQQSLENRIVAHLAGLPCEQADPEPMRCEMLLASEATRRYGVAPDGALAWAREQLKLSVPKKPASLLRFLRPGARNGANDRAENNPAIDAAANDLTLLAIALMRRRQRDLAAGKTDKNLSFPTALTKAASMISDGKVRSRPGWVTARGVLAARAIERGDNVRDAFESARLELADAGLEPDGAAPGDLFAGLWFADDLPTFEEAPPAAENPQN